MNVVVAIAVASLILAGSIVAWHVGGPPGRPLRPEYPVRLIVLVYVVLYGVGSVAIALTGEAREGPLVVGGAFLALAAGAWAGRRVAGPVSWIPTDLVVGRIRPVAIALLALVGVGGYAWLAMQHGIPLLSEDPQAVRSHYGGLRLDVFRWLVPPAALVAFGVALARPTRRAWAAACVLLGIVVGLEAVAASRALPFELGIAAIVVALWAGRRFPWRVWFAVAAAAMVLFLGVQFARIGDGRGFAGPTAAIGFAVNRTVGRVVLIHPRTIDIVVDIYPDDRPYLEGSTYVRWLAWLPGGERPESLGGMLFQELFPEEPPGGFAAPGLLGEAWANGGPALAIVMMFVLGFSALTFTTAMGGLTSGVVDRAFAALIAVALARTYASSLNGFLLTAAVTTVWWLAASGRLVPLGNRVAVAVHRRPRRSRSA